MRVPAEPAGAAGEVARIRVRLPPPHDYCLERRFHAHDTLEVTLNLQIVELKYQSPWIDLGF